MSAPSSSLFIAGIGLVAWALVGCGGAGHKPDGGPEAAWPEGTVVLGAVGVDGGGFVELPSEVEGSPGAQGGFHVAMAYRVLEKTQAGVRFEHRVRRSRDGTLVSKGNRLFDVTPQPESATWTTQSPVIIFMCPTPIGVNVVGEELTFEVTASMGEWLLGKATARTVFRCQPGNSFCESICKG